MALGSVERHAEPSEAYRPIIYDVMTSYGEKKNLTPNGESIIGLRDPSLTVNSTGTLTTTTFDTTTYGDRAIVKLTNATGSSINLTGLCIKGKPVMQLAGQNGYVWEYSDYDAIEKEGEQFVEVSNDFIFNPVQAKQIGDFVWKELKPHKLYSLMLVGCQYQYEIGDVYHLTLEHTMNGRTMENIDTDVEVMGASINRSVGGVGMTNLNLRVPSEAWALTLAKNSKLVGAGNAQRLNNRSNVVTVASSTWTGQADYFCDGTDDNIEIQAAIDYLYSLGGGNIILTTGRFIISSAIIMKNNTTLEGYNYGTLISPKDNSIFNLINANGKSLIANFTIDGNGMVYNFTTEYNYAVNGEYFLSINKINVQNYSFNQTYEEWVNVYFLYKIDSANISSVYNISGSSSLSTHNISMKAFGYIKSISNCSVYSILVYGVEYYHDGFFYCSSVSSCRVDSCTGTAVIRGFVGCSGVSSCSSENNIAYDYEGFYSCTNISVCLSKGNTGSLNEWGFFSCHSAQQCKSDDTIKYYLSYADSGNINACADTAAGGYNS